MRKRKAFRLIALLLVPALLDHIYWQGEWADVGWLVTLWAWMITLLLLLPLLSVPVRWTSQNHSQTAGNNE
jgi:hypothetical protein